MSPRLNISASSLSPNWVSLRLVLLFIFYFLLQNSAFVLPSSILAFARIIHFHCATHFDFHTEPFYASLATYFQRNHLPVTLWGCPRTSYPAAKRNLLASLPTQTLIVVFLHRLYASLYHLKLNSWFLLWSRDRKKSSSHSPVCSPPLPPGDYASDHTLSSSIIEEWNPGRERSLAWVNPIYLKANVWRIFETSLQTKNFLWIL